MLPERKPLNTALNNSEPSRPRILKTRNLKFLVSNHRRVSDSEHTALIITTIILSEKKGQGGKGKAKGSQERKRKGDITNDESVHNEPPPAKRGKTQPAAEQRTRPVAQHLEVVMDSPVNRRNLKKRPSKDMTHENDPTTPVPSKKAKIGLNEKKATKVEPIRWTGKAIFFSAQMKLIKKLETMITLVGSEVVAQRPTDIDRYTTSETETDAADKEAMPISHAPT